MCVTNTTHRRSNPISLAPPSGEGLPSVLSQRLMGGFAAAGLPMSSTMPTVMPQPAEKCRPKRRRKPQKPGKTAKMNDRHFVVHNYHDHANDGEEDDTEQQQQQQQDQQRRRGGVAVAFPLKLHAVLDQVEADGLAHIISWQPHGRCFVIHQPKEFVGHVMPRYFRQTKLTSFQRQLNLYGFSRLTRGADAGGYYNELFLRGKLHLCKKMTRTKVKGTRFKAASSPDQEPDFYKMQPVVVSPHPSSDEEMSHHSNGTHDDTLGFAAPSAISMDVFKPQSFEPLPIQFQEQIFPLSTPVMYASNFSSSPPPLMPQPSVQEEPPVSEKIFDEAVDELFMDDAGFNVCEFVQDWDPSVNMEPILQDDAQLGFLLEKLLED